MITQRMLDEMSVKAQQRTEFILDEFAQMFEYGGLGWPGTQMQPLDGVNEKQKDTENTDDRTVD